MTMTHVALTVDRRAALDHDDGRVGRDQLDLARPVSLDRGRADDEIRPVRREMPQRHDRLSRLAEAHVVGQDRAAASRAGMRRLRPDAETAHRQARRPS